jgi:hypothetical protein
MSRRRRSLTRACRWIAIVLAAAPLAGCALNGDFGRVRPSLLSDDMHAWIGREAVGSIGEAASLYPLTDDEETLRDLAYPLIEPPYERARWYSVLADYRVIRPLPRYPYDRSAYWASLALTYRRSEASIYAQITTDARNDVTRIDPFFALAARVNDMDQKRAQSLGYVADLTEVERVNALARNNENAAVMAWVCRSLADRAVSYRYALERVVIAAPSTAAVESERSLTLLQSRISAYCKPPPARPVVSKR